MILPLGTLLVMLRRRLSLPLLVLCATVVAGCASASSTTTATGGGAAVTQESVTMTDQQAAPPPPARNTREHDAALFMRGCLKGSDGMGNDPSMCRCMLRYLEHPNTNNDKLHNVVTGNFDADSSTRTIEDWIEYEGTNATRSSGASCESMP